MKVRYASRATRELAAIFKYLSDVNPQAAADVVAAIENTAAVLSTSPYMGVATTLRGVRVVTVARQRYRVYYRIDRDHISILPIRHTSRSPWPAAR
jgi:toxin ParE1/3/4